MTTRVGLGYLDAMTFHCPGSYHSFIHLPLIREALYVVFRVIITTAPQGVCLSPFPLYRGGNQDRSHLGSLSLGCGNAILSWRISDAKVAALPTTAYCPNTFCKELCPLKVKVLVAQSCLTLSDPMDCSLPSSSVRGILQARILERVAMHASRGSSQPRDQIRVSCFAGRFFTIGDTKEATKKGQKKKSKSTKNLTSFRQVQS